VLHYINFIYIYKNKLNQ